MINIVTQPEKRIRLSSIEIIAVRDLFEEKTITARVKDLPCPIILWKGDEEYTLAGNWTNETALERATEVLSLPNIPWV
jgi:hypothetical protein